VKLGDKWVFAGHVQGRDAAFTEAPVEHSESASQNIA
jgi:hypothetical protein